MNPQHEPSTVPARSVRSIAAATGVSILGMGVHTLREFGVSGLLSPATVFLPVATIQALLFLGWRYLPALRSAMRTGLVVSGVFQMIGGAVTSVLPLPFLPFQPEQSLAHYLSHLLLGLSQIPLLLVGLRPGMDPQWNRSFPD